MIAKNKFVNENVFFDNHVMGVEKINNNYRKIKV